MAGRPQEQISPGWVSWKLKWWSLAIVGLVNIGFICALAVLAAESQKSDWIASVSVVPIASFSDVSFASLGSSQLRWTLVPAVIIALYLLVYNGIVAAVAFRQPFVELRRASKTRKNMASTLMLDYSSYPLWYVWTIAMNNGHVLLGFLMLLQLLASIFLISLTANVFVANASRSNFQMTLSFPREFSTDLFDSRTDLQPALDLASAIHLHGARPPPWMNTNYAFERFEPMDQEMTGNFTGQTFALSSVLDCRIIDQSAYTLLVEEEELEGRRSLTIDFVDMDCNISSSFAITSATSNYALTRHHQCRGQSYDRIALYTGVYSDDSPGNLGNLIVVSCTPTYWNSTFSLTVSMDAPGNEGPNLVSAVEESRAEIDLLVWSQIHRLLEFYQYYDPSSTFLADIFGKSVYKYALGLNPDAILVSRDVEEAMIMIYQTMFAGLALTALMQLRIPAATAPGQASVTVTRLYLDQTVVWVLVAILSAMLVGISGSGAVVWTTKSILREEPKGLLCYARLLRGSDVMSVVEEFDQRHSEVDDMRDYMKAHYHTYITGTSCYYDEHEHRVRVGSDAMQDGWVQEPKFWTGRWRSQKFRSCGRWFRGVGMKIWSKLKAIWQGIRALRKPTFRMKSKTTEGGPPHP